MITIKIFLRKVLAIAICLISSTTIFSQDIITLKNGDDIQAEVQEIGIDNVKYKKYVNPNGPIYTLKKSEIFMIKYVDGKKDVFNEAISDEPINKQQLPELAYKNGVWQNGIKITPNQVSSIMSANGDAFQHYSSGRALSIVGQIIVYPSAVCLGYDLGTRLGGGTGNELLLGIGAAGTVVGMIIAYSGESLIKTSIQLYNSNLVHTSSFTLNFGLTQAGIGISMRF